jgi:hypothetical protein
MQLNLCVKPEIKLAWKLQIWILNKSKSILPRKDKKQESFPAAKELVPARKRTPVVNQLGQIKSTTPKKRQPSKIETDTIIYDPRFSINYASVFDDPF